ncbi:hypothetical protein AAVH_23246 [Aphelenchoides avenae]|nr:hypothetical protein AAVH_23246 [Aphelenchus avenae]
MQPELRYEILLFCTRNELEHLQPLSRTLLDVIVARAKKLPLRPISWVRMRPAKGWTGLRFDGSVTDVIHFHLNDPEEIDGETEYGDPDYETSVMNGDFEELYRRLQNVSIDYFSFDISENRFMQYWRAQQGASNFTVKDIGFRLRADTDYDTLDCIVNFLHPTEFDSVSCSSPSSKYGLTGSQWTDLLKRDSFLSTVKTTSLTVSPV